MTSADHPRLRRWGRRALFWLPILVLVAVGAAAVAAVARLDGPDDATASALQAPRPDRPLLDLRRDLDRLADQVADRRLEQALTAFVGTMPPDTCLSVDAGGFDFAHRADDPQTPASLQKLLTAVAALTVLGPDHRFRTTVRSTPPADGVIAGDLHLVGGGDPLLAVPGYVDRFDDPTQPYTDLTALADAVAAGVGRIEGAVVADETRYDQQRYHPSWPLRFRSQGQTGPLSALSVNDGFVSWPAEGRVPVEPATDPAAHAATVFADLLAQRGVAIAGGTGVAPAPADLPELAAVSSPPMTEVVGQMLAQSDNNTAELLLKELGVATAGEGSFAAGARAVRDALAGTGLDLRGVSVVDGSGLSTDGTVTCELAVDLLDHPPVSDDLAAGLAVAGESGTLVDRWLDTALEGRVRAKTGTLNQVTALAGLAGVGGAHARFALIVNVPGRIDTSTIEAQQRLVEVLLAHPDRPDVDHLRPGR